MTEQVKLTDSEKIDRIEKQMKRIEISTHIQTAIVIIGFLGIVSLSAMISKAKHAVK